MQSEYLPPAPPVAKKKHIGRTIALVIAGLFVLGVLSEIGNSTDKGAVSGTDGGPVVTTFAPSELTSSDRLGIDVAMSATSASDIQLACMLIDANRPKAVSIWMHEGDEWSYTRASEAVDYIESNYC
jgi:hypothetical protein